MPLLDILIENSDNLELFNLIGLAPNTPYYSPVNKENKPSTFVYYNKESKKYLFKDFSSGKGGTPIDYVAIKFYNGDREKAKEHIINLISDKGLKINTCIVKLSDIVTKNIPFELNFVSNDKNYFTTNFKIPVKKLPRYGIFQCKEYQINSEVYKPREGYLFVNHKLTPLQIYLPYKKERKHINLGSSYNYNYIHNESKTLIITGSYKDGIVVSHIFDDSVDVLCLLSENYTSSARHVLNEKRTVIHEQYSKVYLLFDNDKKGYEASKEIKNNIYFITVPNYSELYEGYKDVSDFVCSNFKKSKQHLWNKLPII